MSTTICQCCGEIHYDAQEEADCRWSGKTTYEVRPGVRAEDGSFERWPLLYVNNKDGNLLRAWAIGDETPEAIEAGKQRDRGQMRIENELSEQ